MDLNTFLKGSCEEFCSQSEMKMRTKEKLLHFYELNPPRGYNAQTKQLPIACFSRSAAGTTTPRQSDLRTFKALSRTVEYLLKYILMDNRKPFNFKYDFVFDRLRSVRQEIFIQQLSELETIKLYEPIVMFLSFSSYELCELAIDAFDPKICREHLQECLKTLLCCYDEIDQQYDDQNKNHSRNREFCECLFIILNLGDFGALNRAIHLRNSYINGDLFNMCLVISTQYFIGNFHNAKRLIKLLPPILCGLAVLSLQKIRREVLLRFSHAYHSKTLTVKSNWLADVLLYDDVQLLISDCQFYNVEVDLSSKDIRFDKFNFDAKKLVIKPRHEPFADVMLAHMPIADVLLFIEKITWNSCHRQRETIKENLKKIFLKLIGRSLETLTMNIII